MTIGVRAEMLGPTLSVDAPASDLPEGMGLSAIECLCRPSQPPRLLRVLLMGGPTDVAALLTLTTLFERAGVLKPIAVEAAVLLALLPLPPNAPKTLVATLVRRRRFSRIAASRWAGVTILDPSGPLPPCNHKRYNECSFGLKGAAGSFAWTT